MTTAGHAPAAGAGPEPRRHVLQHRHWAALAAVVFVVIAALVIHEISAEIHLDQIKAALADTPWRPLLLALVFTALSFAAMGLYDVVGANRVAPGRVPARLAMLAGTTGFAVSNAVGFHVFTGGPIRYRIYATRGLDVAAAGYIVSNALATFWLGVIALLGVTLLIDPVGLPFLSDIDPRLDRAIGGAILLALAAVVVWLALAPRVLTLRGWRLVLPGGKGMLAQIGLGVVDVGAAAAALYVLLPADLAPGFAVFVLIYVAAISLGAVSHVPGGLGVLEATVLVGLDAGTRPDAIAALVVYRLVYYFLPLILAGLALAVFELRRGLGPALSGKLLRAGRPIVPPLAAALVFAGGLVLLVTGALPAEGGRLLMLERLLPLPFAEASHLLASLVGLLLLVLARGLLVRRALACTASIGLLLAGAVFALLRGLDWEEALPLAAIAGLLFAYRGAFHRAGDWRSFRPTPYWLALVVIVLTILTLVGLLAFRHVEYRAELWWAFAWQGDAPRFLRATLIVGLVVLVIALDLLLRQPQLPAAVPAVIPDPVRRILADCPDTQAFAALIGDKRFLVADGGDAFLMYGAAGRSWVSMGDPVGEPKAAAELAWRFAELADRAGAQPVFYALGTDHLPLYLDLGLAILKTGEVARVPLPDFSLEGKRRQDLRQALHRTERDGLTFDIVPQADVPALLPALKEVSDAWLAIKAGREKGFSLGRFDERYLAAFDIAVLLQGETVVAFANLLRGANRHELSIDLMRYRPDVSKSLMDALFAHLMIYGQEAGYQWFNLGAAPLAGLADHPLASTWNRLGTFVYRHGDEFYHFEGLRAFKQKLDPVWTPQYLACHGGLRLPKVLLDVATLISGGTAGLLRR